MNGCSKRIGSPEPRCIGARSVICPTLKVIPAGTQTCRVRAVAVASLTVSTINVNGIRAAIKRRSSDNLGLLPWLDATTADVVCLQETRADDEQLAGALAPALSDGWHLASAGGDVKGRNGVAVLSRHPIRSVKDLGADEFALHGRYVDLDIDGLTVRERLRPDRRCGHRPATCEGAPHGGAGAPGGRPARSPRRPSPGT